jgi:hypothetical protein
MFKNNLCLCVRITPINSSYNIVFFVLCSFYEIKHTLHRLRRKQHEHQNTYKIILFCHRRKKKPWEATKGTNHFPNRSIFGQGVACHVCMSTQAPMIHGQGLRGCKQLPVFSIATGWNKERGAHMSVWVFLSVASEGTGGVYTRNSLVDFVANTQNYLSEKYT